MIVAQAKMDGLIGCGIEHPALGRGSVAAADERRVTVRFAGETCRFPAEAFLASLAEANGEDLVRNVMFWMKDPTRVVLALGPCPVLPSPQAPPERVAAPVRPVGPPVYVQELHRKYAHGLIGLQAYYPRRTGFYDEWSEKILALKKGEAAAIQFFAEQLDPLIAQGVVVVTVPSHDPAKAFSGIRALGRELAGNGRLDATDLLVRKYKVDRKSGGGSRDPEVDRASILVALPELIEGRPVLLLDDILTTGGSLRTCRELLQSEAKPASVGCLALGRTQDIPDQEELETCAYYLH